MKAHFHIALLLTLTAASSLHAATPIVIVVSDPPGIGFNDPTPAEPVRGNSGTTLGEQRLIVFQYAAAIWSSKLESPVPIRIRAGFEPLPCNPDSGALAAATESAVFISRNGNSEMIRDIWYPPALTNHILGEVLDPQQEEILVTINGNMGKPDCMSTTTFYLGLDNKSPATQADLAVTLIHEIAHGLGFGPTPQRSTYTKFQGNGDIYGQYLYDTTVGKSWNEMTDAERIASAVRTRAVVWNGVNVRRAAPEVLRLGGTPNLGITGPASLAGNYYVATASFGAALSAADVGDSIVLALDEADSTGRSTTDACSTILNGSEILGHIALADRGNCTFVQKARNAQAAGARALIIVNSTDDAYPPGMQGTAPDVAIPVVQITRFAGAKLKAALEKSEVLNGKIGANRALLAGADDQGRPMVFNPSTLKSGSTISHWDPAMTPSQIMEPDIVADMVPELDLPRDLTISLLRDLGWFSDFDGVPDGRDECPGSDRVSTLVLQGCDTGVANTTLPNGCRISDFFKPCADSSGPSAYASCAAGVTQEIQNRGALKPADTAKIQACVAPPK